MIRYRRLYESEESDIKLYDVVRCAGYDWYVINIEGDTVTLLAETDDLGGESKFDKYSNDYRSSEIRKYLNNKILRRLRSANPIPTRLNDVGCTDKVWLLSVDEAKKLPIEIRRVSNWSTWYWLRSPGNRSNYAALVDYDGSIDADGTDVDYDYVYVRPAMRVHIDNLE